MHQRSKTLATWIALFGGALGLHRMYLKGLRDPWAWLHLVPTGLGLIGLQHFREMGPDDALTWVLMPLLGLMIAQAMLHAIVYGLTPDEKWAARWHQPVQSSGWGAVFGVVAALLLGATALMSSIAFGVQKFFEWQLQPTTTSSATVHPDRRDSA